VNSIEEFHIQTIVSRSIVFILSILVVMMKKNAEHLQNIDRAFGNVLRELRKQCNLSQEELGLQSGYHRTYISLLERGLKSPSLRTLSKLAGALKVDLSEMAQLVQHKERSLQEADQDTNDLS